MLLLAGIGLCGFFMMLAVEHLGLPGQWSPGPSLANVLNCAFFLYVSLALLPLLHYRSMPQTAGAGSRWKAHSVYGAFFLALLTEMFGIPLILWLGLPFHPAVAHGSYPFILGWRSWLGEGWIGVWLAVLGVLLVVAGWVEIHRADGLVTRGIYRYMRHQQYLGIFLFSFGWFLRWPTLTTLFLWPILVMAYLWLAFREERALVAVFGDAYRDYAAATPRFSPIIVWREQANRMRFWGRR